MPVEANLILASALALGGYLLGSVSSAIITCRLLRLPDPRTLGSGNPGATNVLRTGSKKAAALTLLGDMLKGLIAVVLAQLITNDPLSWAAAATGAFLGHLYPLYFNFQGGKGVATALGALFALSLVTGLLAITTWLAVTLTFRLSSLSALITFALAPAYLWLITGNRVLVVTTALVAILLFWRHRQNIRNMIEGTEGRIGEQRQQP